MTDVEELEGRELDAAVASEVMGFEWIAASHGKCKLLVPSVWGEKGYVPKERCQDWHRHVPTYSTSISAAWEVVDEIRPRRDEKGRIIEPGFDITIFSNEQGIWYCAMRKSDDSLLVSKTGENAPLAICRAVLKAVRSEE